MYLVVVRNRPNRPSPNLNENFNVWIWDSDLPYDVMLKYGENFNQDLLKLRVLALAPSPTLVTNKVHQHLIRNVTPSD